MPFDKEVLTAAETARLGELAGLAKGDIVTMTKVAGSGHPGGSMSSLDIYLTVFSYANLLSTPRDRVVVSHGHTSPGVYSALARLGHLPVDDVVAFFRKAGSPFEGHVVRGIPFIDWSTGNLGQGLSAGCGFALRAKITEERFHVYVLMSDGEQAKGQVAEARRFASKFGLANVTVVIDHNRIQISGDTGQVMPVNIVEDYLADGWDVLEVDGHDHAELYAALRKARISMKPTAIVAHTVIGKGVPFMEDKAEFHGRALNDKEYAEAAAILGFEDRLQYYHDRRKGACELALKAEDIEPSLDVGEPFTYAADDPTDNRTAFGKALKDMAERNISKGVPVCAFDCDLASSVKTGEFAKAFPQYFFQSGVQEHNTATIAGALSSTGVVTFFADFGVFGIDEVYNQQRLNDINRTNLKTVITHVGLDVGQDGKTHQCIDYIGLARNLYNFRVIIPADTNQVDRAVRYAASHRGNFLIGTGRGRWTTITDEAGKMLFSDGYRFEYGKMDVVRKGKDGAIVSHGAMLGRALQVRDSLLKDGLEIGVINMPCVGVVDDEVMTYLRTLPQIVTYEDHNPATGIASVIAIDLLKHGYAGRLTSFGVKGYGKSGDPEELFKMEGLDVDSVAAELKRLIGKPAD